MTNVNPLAVAALSVLADSLEGHMVLPDTDGYDDLRKPWLQVLEQRPALIVEAVSIADVVAAVNFARTQNIELAIMATGHGIAAACNGGLLLRLSRMKDIAVDPERKVAKVGPGVVADEFLAKTQPHGLVYATGQVTSVGVIGYVLGGGMGWLVRKLGAASDAVLAADVVLANGSLVHASASENPELFWALRGGGGNFGVVVALEMALAAIPAVVGGEIYYPLEQAGDVLRLYRDWSSGLSEQTSTIVRLQAPAPGDDAPPALRGRKTCMIGLCHADPATADAVLKPLERLGQPLLKNVERRTIAQMAQLDPASQLPSSPTYGQVEFLKTLSDEVIDRLVQVAETEIPPLTQLEVQQLGGALMRRTEEDGTFQTASAPYLLHLVSVITPKVPMEALAKATDGAFAALGNAYTGKANYNFLRWNEQERIPAAFGELKYRRLQAAKRHFDPDNLFHLNLNIPPQSDG